jgi:hypothetical protein
MIIKKITLTAICDKCSTTISFNYRVEAKDMYEKFKGKICARGWKAYTSNNKTLCPQCAGA